VDPAVAPLNTFVLRLWESMDDGAPVWRGDVKHIQTGEHVAFVDEATLLDFLRRWVRMPADPLTVDADTDMQRQEPWLGR